MLKCAQISALNRFKAGHPGYIPHNTEMEVQMAINWDITDVTIPKNLPCDKFEKWPDGNEIHIYDYNIDEQARRHISGWAMRNTNNHNRDILKKSCLGVLLCKDGCLSKSDGKLVTLRPAICDKARKKQIKNKCPNCKGDLILQQCRGNSGYPITHFWRKEHDRVYFQGKGSHDHPRPDIRPHRECRQKSWINDEKYEYMENTLFPKESTKPSCCINCFQYVCQCQNALEQIRHQLFLTGDHTTRFCQPYNPIHNYQQCAMRTNYFTMPSIENEFYSPTVQITNPVSLHPSFSGHGLQSSLKSEAVDCQRQYQQMEQFQKTKTNLYFNPSQGMANHNYSWNGTYAFANPNSRASFACKFPNENAIQSDLSQDLSFAKFRPTINYPLI